jgi:hypothetical protein
METIGSASTLLAGSFENCSLNQDNWFCMKGKDNVQPLVIKPHTHTHTDIERERQSDRERERERASYSCMALFLLLSMKPRCHSGTTPGWQPFPDCESITLTSWFQALVKSSALYRE